MKRLLSTLAFAACAVFLAHSSPAADAEPGFKTIFNGTDLTGWDGNPKLWFVKDGAIVGSTVDNLIKENTFLIWKDEKPANFEIRFSFQIKSENEKGFANSGMQYRSKIVKPANWVLAGYQADIDAEGAWVGGLYEEKGRGSLAKCGQKTVIDAAGKKETVKDSSLATQAEVTASIKKDDWNDYVVIAKGNHLEQFINGKKTIDVTDDQEVKSAKDGVIGLQLHQGPAMSVRFKDIRIKSLD